MPTLRTGLTAILTPTGTIDRIVDFPVSTAVKDGFSLPVTMTAQPAFDLAIQKVEQDGWLVNAAAVTSVWKMVSLSADELTERAERAQIADILSTADDLLNGAGTAAQRQLRVEKALGLLLKRLSKNGTIP